MFYGISHLELYLICIYIGLHMSTETEIKSLLAAPTDLLLLISTKYECIND